MNKTCKIFVIDDYNYQNDIKLALKIAKDIKTKHGDIICGKDYHMNSTSLIYKQNDEIKIINALDFNEFPKTVFNVPIEISKFIKNPHIFYKKIFNNEKSLLHYNTFICEVKLSKEHEHFISKFTQINFEKYNYTIDANELYMQNKNEYYDIQCFNYK